MSDKLIMEKMESKICGIFYKKFLFFFIKCFFLLKISIFSAHAFAGELTLEQKQRNLYPFFYPRIGSIIELDIFELRAKRKEGRYEAKGSIQVTPPKKKCLTITRRADIPDIRVCKPKFLFFSIDDLNEKGGLTWQVTLDGELVPTAVEWLTPYKVGDYADYTMKWPGKSAGFIVAKCLALRSSLGREMKVTLLDGTEWRVTLPPEDLYIPSGKERPKLFIGKPKSKVSKKQKKSEHDAEKKEEGGHEEGGHEEKKEEAPKEQEHGAEKPLKKETKTGEPLEGFWELSSGSYEMSGSNFHDKETGPGGVNHHCRYIYEGYKTDKAVGALECKEVGGYQWFIAPLSCIGELKP